MLEHIVQAIVDAVAQFGYLGIFLMMFLESTFFPIPSELVMIPAGYLAYKGEMSFWILQILGIAGSIGGALFNYYFAKKVGRGFIIRFKKYLLIDEKALVKLEDFFKNHGHISTFTGRLIPVARHLISLPAGLARMDLKLFIFYTGAGSAIWVFVLISVGYFIGHNEALIKQYMHLITICLGVAITMMVTAYICWHRSRRRRIVK